MLSAGRKILLYESLILRSNLLPLFWTKKSLSISLAENPLKKCITSFPCHWIRMSYS